MFTGSQTGCVRHLYSTLRSFPPFLMHYPLTVPPGWLARGPSRKSSPALPVVFPSSFTYLPPSEFPLSRCLFLPLLLPFSMVVIYFYKNSAWWGVRPCPIVCNYDLKDRHQARLRTVRSSRCPLSPFLVPAVRFFPFSPPALPYRNEWPLSSAGGGTYPLFEGGPRGQ